jgi:hypothetical protein
MGGTTVKEDVRIHDKFLKLRLDGAIHQVIVSQRARTREAA